MTNDDTNKQPTPMPRALEAEGTPVTPDSVMPPQVRPQNDWKSVLDQLPPQPIL